MLAPVLGCSVAEVPDQDENVIELAKLWIAAQAEQQRRRAYFAQTNGQTPDGAMSGYRA